MTSRPLHSIAVFFVLMVFSCQQESKGREVERAAKSSKQDSPTYLVNSNGDSIPTGIPIRIEGKYIPMDSSKAPKLLAIEETKEAVQIRPAREVLKPPTISITRGDTMPFIRDSDLKRIPSKGKTTKVKYPVSTDALQPGTVKGSQVDIRHWGIDQNMTTSSFWTMIQDRRGDLWFGSLGSGAIRFNGDRFDQFSESEGLSGNYVFAIYEDSKGNIWFGTGSGGVTCFDGEYFTSFTSQDGLANNFVLSIIEDHKGNMWFGTRGGLCRYDGEQFTHYTTREGLAYNEVLSIYEDSKHQLWVGTGEGSGIHKFDGQQFVHFDLGQGKGGNDVHSILEDQSGNMWFGTWGNGLVKFDGERLERYTTEQGLTGSLVTSILEEQDGALWLGILDGGIAKFEGNTITNYTEKVGLSSNDVKFVFQDKEEIIWACTMDNGVNRLNPDGFQQIGHDGLVNFGEVLCMTQDQKENKWLGTSNGLFKYDGDHLTHVTNKESRIKRSIGSILIDKDQNVWVGVSGGVCVLSQTGIKDYTQENGLSLGDVRALLQDKTGHIWLGTYAGGVIRFDGNGFTQFAEQYGFVSDDVYAIFEDSKGHFWFGTQGRGVCHYDGNFFTLLSTDEGLIHNSVQSILEDQQGNLWFGTEDGLSKYDGDSFENFSVEDGLIHHKIFSMMLHDEKIWISTQKGISIFDPEEKQFTNLDKSDVLGQQNLSTGNILADEQNKLWVGNLGGTVVLDLEQFGRAEKASLELKIADIKINDKSIDYRSLPQTGDEQKAPFEFDDRLSLSRVTPFYNLPEDLTVPYRLNHLSFHASAIDWHAPGRIRYSFYLKGVDKDWSVPQTNARIDYRNLPYGSFTLGVKAIDYTGAWSEPISYTFTISPPWYHTWFAYAIYVLTIAVTFYLLYRTLLTRKMAIAEGQRLKEIDDLKTNIYTNITHEFRTPLTVINGMANALEQSSDTEVLYQSGMIKKNSQKLLSLVNQLLKLSSLTAKKEEVNLQQADIILFIKYLIASFDSLASVKQISLQYYTKDKELLMEFDAEKLETILSNLLSNAIKFTNENGIILVKAEQVKLEGNLYLEMTIKDNGIGISTQDLPLIFDRFHQASNINNGQGTGIGLAIVKELVTLMKGAIKVESTLGEGSQFVIHLPVVQNAPFPLPSADTQAPLDEKVASEISNGSLPVLLIIEDNPDIIEYLHYCLKDHYTVVSSGNGDQGIEKAIQTIPDIIISDVMMPGKDGFELCKALKEDKRTNHIPIILLTAKVDLDNKLKGLTSGADAYLTKPFEKEELLIRLDKLLLVRKTLQQKYLEELKERYGLGHIEVKPGNNFLGQVETAIVKHLSDDSFSVNELAEIIHLSRSQLNRKIKASTGMSTSLYIRHLRLLEAQKLLQHSDLSVTEILYQVGFNSPAYFSQAYKNLFGHNPSEERDTPSKDAK